MEINHKKSIKYHHDKSKVKFIMLGSYIFKHITAKLLPKTKSSTIDRGDLVLEWTVYCKRLSSTISKQDFNQNVAATMT